MLSLEVSKPLWLWGWPRYGPWPSPCTGACLGIGAPRLFGARPCGQDDVQVVSVCKETEVRAGQHRRSDLSFMVFKCMCYCVHSGKQTREIPQNVDNVFRFSVRTYCFFIWWGEASKYYFKSSFTIERLLLESETVSHTHDCITHPFGKCGRCESLLSHLSGSEGKLTVVAQKISVLSGTELPPRVVVAGSVVVDEV